MKSKHGIMAIYALCILFVVTGCEFKAKKAINFGKYESGIYTNTFFKVKIAVPEKWSLMDKEARIEMLKQGGKLVAGDDKNLNEIMDAADFSSLNLLLASEYPIGAPEESNPILILIAEKVDHLPGIIRGKDYHLQTKKLMASGALSVSYPKEIYEEQIDGISFDVLEVDTDVNGEVVKQKQYARIMGKYVLLFGLTYVDGPGLQKLDRIMSSVDFYD